MARESALSRLPALAKVGITGALLVLVAVAYYVLFYGDLARSITAEETRAGQLTTQLDSAKDAELEYQKAVAELADREQRQRELNKVLPTDSNTANFLGSIQNVAHITGVKFVSYSWRQEQKDKYYSRIPMEIEIDGKYHQIAKFFYQVGQLDRIINMENIKIEPQRNKKGDGDEGTVLRVTALATAFRSLDAQPTAQAADKRGGAMKR